MEPTLVRAARAEDAKVVIDLLVAEELEAAFEHSEFVVAEDAGRVVAAARLKPVEAGHEIASVVVAPHRRGERLGEAVVRAALENATGPVWGLALAPGFFERLGFVRLDEAPPALREKADGICASSGFVPMAYAPDGETVRARVRAEYGRIAVGAAAEGAACCGPATSSEACCAPEKSAHYSAEELAALPPGAHLDLGSGNPVRRADLKPGEVVVDLGSGGGVDVFLAARAVGPTGKAIGVDMTPQMIARARENAAKAGVPNVEFVEAPIERVPLPDGVADVLISNCVVNLSPEKPTVLKEALRILKPGGRFVVSDKIRVAPAKEGTPIACNCTTGALTPREWVDALAEAGFEGARVEAEGGSCCGPGEEVVDGLVTATKPESRGASAPPASPTLNAVGGIPNA